MRFFSFGAPFAVRGFSPILFDGSTSRGEGLQYFIEFGDREFTTEPSAVHPIASAGCPAGIRGPCFHTARLTVVDRFGRSDQEAIPFDVRSLVSNGHYVHWERSSGVLGFVSQEGPEVIGAIYSWDNSSPSGAFRGTLSGERDIRLVLDGSDIVLTGTLSLSGSMWPDWKLRLTQTGGPDHGRTYEFQFRNGY